MTAYRTATAILLAWIATAAWAGDVPPDSDGDGIWDTNEESLGADPAAPEVFHPVFAGELQSEAQRGRAGYDATKDVTAVEFCHVGENRYLWKVTFAAEPRLADTVLHLYVDADADRQTGRKGPEGSTVTGTEYMLSVVGGRGSSSLYRAGGEQTSGPSVAFAVQGKTLYLSADIDLGRDPTGIRFALYVLCHTLTTGGQNPAMSDSTGKKTVSGIAASDRKKRVLPAFQDENYRVDATFGLDLLWDVLGAKDTVVVPHDKLQTDGFEVDLFTSRRMPHVSRVTPGGKVWTAAPKGRYHVGFMMYDDSQDERVAIAVDGKLAGVAVARQDNNRTWLYWLAEPREFAGGERVELRGIGPGGKHGICNILFLPRTPEVRRIEYRVENMAAAAPVDRPGSAILSWTTTWPCATRFEFGPSADATVHGDCPDFRGARRENRTVPLRTIRTIEAEGTCLVHRVVLEGLDPAVAYHGRAIGTSRDGTPFHGPDFTFRAVPPTPPPTRAEATAIPVVVENPHDFAVERWPVSGGVPFPRGQLGNLEHVRLMNDQGEVPSQVRLLARWPDGSVKWALVTFAADAPPGGRAAYRLEFGREVRRGEIAGGITVAQDGEGATIDTGPIRFRVGADGNVCDVQRGGKAVFGPGGCATLAVLPGGETCGTTAGPAALTVEEAGPLRAVVKSTSLVKDPAGRDLLQIVQRIEAWRGQPMLRIHHTFVVLGEGKFTELKELSYRIPTQPGGCTWRAPLASGESVVLGPAPAALQQRFDDELIVAGPDGEKPRKDRAIGAALGNPSEIAVAVRDFWQDYPKAIAIRPDGLHLALCPRFEPGIYDAFPFEKEGHHLYYYLRDGRYRLKQGVAKTHELLLTFGPEAARERSCRLFQRPPLATPSPEWCCGSRALYNVAPRNEGKFRLYEEAIDKNLVAYAGAQERQRDFGTLNYGDWYGERGANWGNVEYDTQHAFFLEYYRSGNPAAFLLGEATELHNRDVDTVHFSPDPHNLGGVYVHQMCHVGDYYDQSVPGTLGIPRAGFSVSHAWVEGHFDHYCMTGDRRSFETGCAVADFFTRQELGRPYDFSNCREPGWHLIMLSAAYNATGDPYYLNAAKVVVARVLESQDTKPRPLPDYQAAGRTPYQVGGWSRMMVPGHCHCEPRHRGNAGFMVAVLLSGLKYYHDLTEDPRVKECIIRGSHYLLDETYSDEVHGFRYTSCPKTSYSPGASPLMAEGVARAYLWTRDERFRRVLTEALPRSAGGSSYGKGFSMYYRTGPRVLADLDAAGIAMDGNRTLQR